MTGVMLLLFGLLLKQQMVRAQDTWDEGSTWEAGLTEMPLKFWGHCWLHGVRGLPVSGDQSQGLLLSYGQVGDLIVPASRVHLAATQRDCVCLYLFSYSLSGCFIGWEAGLAWLSCDFNPLPLLCYCVFFRILLKDHLPGKPFLTPFLRNWVLWLFCCQCCQHILFIDLRQFLQIPYLIYLFT